MQGSPPLEGAENWLLVGRYFSGWGKDPTPSRENSYLHSSLRCFWFQGNLYTIFVILDIKFRVTNIEWNLLIYTWYYLLNWALASVCSCSQTSWILFTVSTCRAVVHSFQNIIWTAMTLQFTATSYFACVHGRYDSIWCYLNWTLVLIFLVLPRIMR